MREWLQSTLQKTAENQRVNDGIFYASFLVLSVLLVLPIWEIYYLPLGDLADHAAQLRVILNYEQYREDYYINWFTPYLVGYVIALFFALIFPIPIALKIALSISLVCIPLSCLYLLRNLKGNRYWVWICFPMAFSFSFYWGFYSYIIATPIAILVIAYAAAYSQQALTARNFAIAALLSAFLFLAHAMAWAMSMVLVGCILWIGRSFKDASKRFFPFVVIVPMVIYWAANVGPDAVKPVIEVGRYTEHYLSRFEREVKYVTEQWQFRSEKGEHTQRLKELFAYAIGRSPALDYVLISFLLVIWPLFSGAQVRGNPKYWLPLLSVIAAFLIVPYWIFDTAYVYLRFAVFLFPAFFFLYRYRPVTEPSAGADISKNVRQIASYTAAFSIVLLLMMAVNKEFQSFKENDRAFAKILDEMESEKSVLTLVFNHDSPFRYSPPYLHFGSWYQSVKGGVEMMSFSHDAGAQNVPVRYRHQTWPTPSTWDPSEFRWDKHEGFRYDYFLVRSKTDKSAALFGRMNKKAALQAHYGDWYLYRKIEKP
jgi:hypothetical protein